MMAAPVETMLELRAASLRDVKARIRPLSTQARVAAPAGCSWTACWGRSGARPGGCGPRRRAEAAGDPGPWRQQAILGRGRWDADSLRDVVRDHALETLAAPDAVLVIDGTGFLKQGKAPCGVGRQCTGSAGKITDCRTGVAAAYVSRHGRASVDRALHLPKAWTGGPARLAAAHVPAEAGFATKPSLARRMAGHAMAGHAMAAGVPFAWVAADTACGAGELEMALRRAGEGYVPGQPGTRQIRPSGARPDTAGTAGDAAAALAPSDRQRLPAGAGTKGPRTHDWAHVELAGFDGPAQGCPGSHGLWTRGLLARRSLAGGACAFSATRRPAGTGIETLAAVEGRRWATEDSFEAAENGSGLDHGESRSWHGWRRHVSLVALAFAMPATIRRHANPAEPRSGPRAPALSQTTQPPAHARQASFAGRSRKSAAPPSASRNDASGRPTSLHGHSGDARTKPPRNAHM